MREGEGNQSLIDNRQLLNKSDRNNPMYPTLDIGLTGGLVQMIRSLTVQDNTQLDTAL